MAQGGLKRHGPWGFVTCRQRKRLGADGRPPGRQDAVASEVTAFFRNRKRCDFDSFPRPRTLPDVRDIRSQIPARQGSQRGFELFQDATRPAHPVSVGKAGIFDQTRVGTGGNSQVNA